MKPFLKWAGNKYQIIEAVRLALPVGNRLIEPFVGSAAVFLNTDFHQPALLSDINEDLITLYQILQAEGDAFIDYARTYFTPENNQEPVYYMLRTQFNTTRDPREKAALFLYLNRHGYNGLCRYNSRGEYNVPCGRYKTPYFPQQEMQNFHQKSKSAVFTVIDFETAMLQAQPGDVVYCDPPYVPLTSTAKFTSYSRHRFGPLEQNRLAELAELLRQRGVCVLISNHDTPFTQTAYRSAQLTSLQVQRYISAKGDNRGKASELLALFAP